MKSCRIESFSYCIGSTNSEKKFESVTVSEDSKVHSISEYTKCNHNTIFSIIERSLVQDFTEYYDRFDNELGIEYDRILKSKIYLSNNSEVVFTGTELQSSNEDNLFCIRQLDLDNIRSFEVGLQEKDFSDLVGKNMTEMSVALEMSTWVYLEKLVNRVLGWDFVKVDTIGLRLDFIFSEDEEKDRIAKGVYLLLSEIVCFCSRGKFTIVLISELPSDSMIREELLTVLNNIKYDYQVFIP